MSYSGIIFDLDGTLLNTLSDLASSMNFVLYKHGLPIHDVEKYRCFIGNGMEMLVRRALPPESVNQKNVKVCLQELKEEYSRRWHDLTKPYEGINELINTLDSLGIKMAVLSNKPHEFTKIIIDNFFGLERFSFVFGSRDNVPKKPDPFAALEIAKLSEISPSNYLYAGDMGIDMKTANAAGMYAIGAKWGFGEENDLIEKGAKILIENPMDIIRLI